MWLSPFGYKDAPFDNLLKFYDEFFIAVVCEGINSPTFTNFENSSIFKYLIHSNAIFVLHFILICICTLF